jgi:hypothetical protein
MNRSRSKVSWLQCCQPKSKRRVNLINSIDAMMALMVKWVVKATEPTNSNLHHMLRFRSENFQPYSPKFQAERGSKVWNQVGTAWRGLVKEISRV